MFLNNFLINLKRRPDRLDKFNKISPIKDYKLIYGFDGQNIKNEYDNDKVNKFTNLRPGEIGCFISHLRIYETIVKDNIDYALIMEDDAKFCDNFNEKLQNLIKNIKDYDILYIGGRFTPNFSMNPDNYTKITDNIVQHKYNDNYIFNKNPTNNDLTFRIDTDRTTHSYIISKNICKLLLDVFNKSNNIDIPIDFWIIETLHYNNIKIYSCNPLLCYSDLVGDSDIR